MAEAGEKLRLRFAKEGRAVYLSHLDLMRTLQRAFARAELPLKYSEGFNPHPQISILLPLGVGTASECELMDFRLTERSALPELPERLTAVLPEGLRALEVYANGRRSAELKWLRVTGRLEYDGGEPKARCGGLEAFFARPALVIEKKTKRGLGESDIAPAIREVRVADCGGALRLDAVLSAQEPTVSPEHLIAALRQLAPELLPDFWSFTRREVYDARMERFR